MFSGAIGRAYHQIYEPIMPVKDEINSILKIKLKDYYKNLKQENKALKEEIELLKANQTKKDLIQEA